MVLHVRMLRRAASGEYDLAPDQLFSTIEQMLFTKVLAIAEKEGKPVRLAVAAANDLWEGILRTAENLKSSAIVAGKFTKIKVTEQAHEIGLAWERCPSRGRASRLKYSAFRPGTDFLSWAPCAAPDSQRDRSAARDLARFERPTSGQGNPPSRHRSFRSRRSGAEISNGKRKQFSERLKEHCTKSKIAARIIDAAAGKSNQDYHSLVFARSKTLRTNNDLLIEPLPLRQARQRWLADSRPLLSEQSFHHYLSRCSRRMPEASTRTSNLST